MCEIDRAAKVLLRHYPEKFLDLFLGHDRKVVLQGVEDPQINIPERRADKVWLVSDQGQDGVICVEVMLEPKKIELANFNTKTALLEETLKRPVVTVIVYLEKGKYETFPYTHETQIGSLKNTHIFARILLWEHKDCILSGELIELAPLLLLCEDEPDETLLDREKQLINQIPDQRERSNLFSVAVMVAYRKYKDKGKEFVKEKFMEEYNMLKESDFVIDWLEEREQQGFEKGKRSLLQAMLTKKFGTLSQDLLDQLNQLSGEKIDSLSLAILDLNDIGELQAWLENGTTTPSTN